MVEALVRYGLLDRARISTMEVRTLRALKQLEPALHLGWTVPRATRDWTAVPWLRPALTAGVAAALILWNQVRIRTGSYCPEGRPAGRRPGVAPRGPARDGRAPGHARRAESAS